MSDNRPPTANAKRPSADRQRDWIDRGRSGDKVPAADPAAAPLGTDDEAGGASPTAADVDQLLDQEARRDNPRPPAGSAAEGGGATGPAARPWGAAAIIVLVCVAAAVVAVALMTP